jgi:hypothetical protein
LIPFYQSRDLFLPIKRSLSFNQVIRFSQSDDPFLCHFFLDIYQPIPFFVYIFYQSDTHFVKLCLSINQIITFSSSIYQSDHYFLCVYFLPIRYSLCLAVSIYQSDHYFPCFHLPIRSLLSLLPSTNQIITFSASIYQSNHYFLCIHMYIPIRYPLLSLIYLSTNQVISFSVFANYHSENFFLCASLPLK